MAYTLKPQELAELCRASQPDNAHEPFCFELFRRAICEKSEECWSIIYEQYQKLVYRWILDCAKTNQAIGNTQLDDLVTNVFTAFWQAFTCGKLQKAERLNSVLSYLKSCAMTAVLQARRRGIHEVLQQDLDEQEDTLPKISLRRSDNPEFAVLQQNEAVHLWAIVERCCNDERDQIVAWLSFVSDLKANAILEKYPDLFTDVVEIYMIRRNLKNRLARNDQLRTLWREYQQ